MILCAKNFVDFDTGRVISHNISKLGIIGNVERLLKISYIIQKILTKECKKVTRKSSPAVPVRGHPS